jgi:hypothetical protein
MPVAQSKDVRDSHLAGSVRTWVVAAALLGAVTASGTVALAVPLAGGPQAGAAQQPASKPAPRKDRPPRKTFEQFQVPAGNALPIELRSRLSSNSNRPSDHVEGRLLRPIIADGVELVPAGATVMGTVSQAEPAGLRKPGRIAFTFHVIEHPETGSRATIKASVITFESQPPAKGKVFPDVLLEKGIDASVLLLAPLVVRLPIEP